ncbi:Lnb N-terminal periplasmic domain-containing protein [Vibrio sp. SCSIO 43137]|uniref:Lnb N-terminal periplasmic domain-containing protein n=1 Tax=Vibrio sp. SCSIO 43137 TaxID=3021011 RepID=UPI002307A362|nr:DUF4105 domain-containing protein [Vibrio sp. SCSIO 43137]WCE31422.1 DUF4105 domain-containing protein [Vibrio sp. SCSIO 43137]
MFNSVSNLSGWRITLLATFLLLILSAFQPAMASDTAFYVGSSAKKAGLIVNKQKLGQWRKLLHFEQGSSLVTSDSFFIHPDGNINEHLELEATIAAFKRPQNAFPVDEHPQCLFPGRLLWLKRNLRGAVEFPLVECPRLEEWRTNNPVDSISLIFVSGYLSNPASFFGHALLKLNRPVTSEQAETPLLDISVNYGASVADNDGPIKYVTYGIFGGYSAEYTMDDFFVYDAAYAELESRVLWEYKLNLKGYDVELIELHLWELRSQTFRYYFLNRNCATQLANLLEVATDISLVNPYQPWDMPLDIFKNISELTYQGLPLVEQVKRRESKFSRIYSKYLAMTKDERKVAKLISQSVSYFNSDEYLSLSEHSRSKVISLLYDFYEIKILEEDEGEKSYKEIKRRLLMENLTLPPAEIDWQYISSDPPHLAQNPMLFRVERGYNASSGHFSQIDFRLGYYDYLALEAARYRDSNATFLHTELRAYQDSFRLHRMDFFDISTLNILDVDLFDSSRYAWNMKLTLEPESLECENCLRGRFYGGLGIADRAFDQVSLYMIPQAVIDFTAINRSTMAASLGVLYTSDQRWKTHLQISPRLKHEHFNGGGIAAEWEVRLGDSSDWDIRGTAKYDVEPEFSIAYSMYF